MDTYIFIKDIRDQLSEQDYREWNFLSSQWQVQGKIEDGKYFIPVEAFERFKEYKKI